MSPEHLAIARKVRAAYERTADGRGGEDFLLQTVRLLVRALKKSGELPERVVIAIKNACGMPLAPFPGHYDRFGNPDAARFISETLIGVAIEEYFMEPASRPDGPRLTAAPVTEQAAEIPD